MISERTIKTLEFTKILEQISCFASSKPAKNKILSIRPYDSIYEVKEELDKLEQADKLLFEYAISPSLNFDDISTVLDSAAIMRTLTMAELLKVYRVLKVSSAIRSQIINVPDDGLDLLKSMAKTIYTNKSLVDDINKSILSETEMSDNASAELKSIRSKIKKVGENIKSKLNSYVTSPTYSKYIQDNIITIRGDRYVVPVKAEFKGMIPGLIHDQSSSGATLYVEPFVIVEMNNDLKQLILEEEAEIERILREFTYRISNETGFLKYSLEVIIELDIIFAKAYYGNSIKAVKPIFNENGFIDIKKGRHPLIDSKHVIPNDIYIGKNYRMLLITGPNTGGKTVCLKLVGLIELMGMSGIYVPASYAELAKFDSIFCDIGDEQSIEQNLSTFSSHMTNVVSILNEINENSLVLLDELGAGTDPTEGAALALGIAEYLMKIGNKSIITTHYNELKEYAVVTDGVQNASMDFDPTTYSPTYRLIIGTPGASNALLIAEKLGLKQEIIASAKNGISNQKFEFENILLSIEKSRKEAEKNLEDSKKYLEDATNIRKEAENEREKMFAQRERLNVSVRKETKRLVEAAMEEANEIIDELRSLLENPTEANIFRAQKLRKSLKKYIINENNEFQGVNEEIPGEIKVGDRVLIKTLNCEGIVSEINGKGDAKIKVGCMNCKAKICDMVRLKPKQEKHEIKKETKRVLNNEPISHEINLIGKDRIEAEELLREYIDKAYRGGLHEIRIIHGYGEGVLRNMTINYLKTRKEIDKYRDGQYGEGGRGVTIAYFK